MIDKLYKWRREITAILLFAGCLVIIIDHLVTGQYPNRFQWSVAFSVVSIQYFVNFCIIDPGKRPPAYEEYVEITEERGEIKIEKKQRKVE